MIDPRAMTYNPKIYAKLLAQTLPGLISDEQEYARIEAIFNGLMDKGEENLSPEEARLFELLANLLESYERGTLPPLEEISPGDALRFLIQQNGLKQKELEDVFGSQSVVSKVLSGKRLISKAQAKGLAKRFSVAADIFI